MSTIYPHIHIVHKKNIHRLWIFPAILIFLNLCYTTHNNDVGIKCRKYR